MSQRTRAAKAKPTEQTAAVGETAPTPTVPRKGSAARPAPPLDVAVARAISEQSELRAGMPDEPELPRALARTMRPEDLARALRAVAGELERDPALAARIAQAMRGAPGESVSFAAQGGVAGAPHLADAVVSPEPTLPVSAVGRSFRPRIITGASSALGPGVPDPREVRARLGEGGLRAALAELRIGTLRAIVREHHLDPSNTLDGVHDTAKFRALILAASGSRTETEQAPG